MKFSTRTTYGLRAIINLAKNQNTGSVSLALIAKEEKISLKYLEKLFSVLKAGKIIKAEKGASGGYLLAKPAKQISIYEIVMALEGDIAPFHCLSKDGKISCKSACGCGASLVLVKVQDSIHKTLRKIKLSDLL